VVPVNSRKFGILSFNFALLELKKSQPGYMAALHWANAAAELFADCGTAERINQALALTVNM